MSEREYLTMDDFELTGKVVLARVDLNSPIDPMSGEFLDDRRIQSHAKTLKELSHKGARVVVLAHQGRPGDEYEFTTLAKHAKHLEKIMGIKVKYTDELFSESAVKGIKAMKNGEVLVLENLRFNAEEMLERPPDAQTKAHLVRGLAPHADYYLNDAFAAAHRSQPSLVGFMPLLPSFSGRVMELELDMLSKVIKDPKRPDIPKRPSIFMLGGSKAEDSLKVVDKALSNGSADKILTTGLVALIFLIAKGYDLGQPTYEFLVGKKLDKQISYAKELLSKFPDKIELPVDLAVSKQGKRVEVQLAELPLPYKVSDIGSGTIGRYKYVLDQAGTILANGPAGYFESKEFAKGTHDLLSAMAANKEAFTIVSGGHLATAAEQMKISDKLSHVSTGGGAAILLLAGERLPVIEALKAAAKRHKGLK